jgi:hypothetical protein
MAGKYSFAEIKDLDILPVDCNEEAEAFAREFKSPALMAGLRLMREKKVTGGFGELTYLNDNHAPVAIFAFHAGICKHISPMHWVDSKTVIKGSIKIY